MRKLASFLSTVGTVIFVMIVCFLLLEIIFSFFFEVLWYIAMLAVFVLIWTAVLNMLNGLTSLFNRARYRS